LVLAVSKAVAAGLSVVTTGGAVQGVATPLAREFLGIPYAAPPVAALRWRAPQPASWSGVLQANTLPAGCPQPATDFGSASTSEDCLFLNVYAPLAQAAPLPVMVWLHGGAFEEGSASQYDGSALVQNGVIVVTIDYRLGFLGFLAHPTLDAESAGHASGDYGLMDQQAALRWVRANIAAFGGDPGRVTLFGESAGGQAVFDQLVSPGAAGLFQRAIIESGAYAVQLPSLADADARGVAFATAVGCTSRTDASCLRALPVSTLAAAEAGSSGVGGLTEFEPNVNTATLPLQPLAAIGVGLLNRVPVLQGSNHDEARLFTATQYDFLGTPLTAAGYGSAVTGLVGPVAPYAEALYPLAAYPSPDLAYSALFTDVGFSCSARGFDRLLSLHVPTYAYEFTDEDAARLLLPPDPFMPLGAPHSSELPFLWPNLISPGVTMTPTEQALGVQMRAAWTNFARSGNPNGGWPAYGRASDVFEEFVPGAVGTNRSFAVDHRCGFWGPVLALDALLPLGSF
jgi:para-nitrobenzyl esterase